MFVDGEGASFDGLSRITYDISGSNQYIQTRKDLIKLRFRTNQADGLLFFADSNQGDYVVLEMVHGKLYLNIDLGNIPLAYALVCFKKQRIHCSMFRLPFYSKACYSLPIY